MKTAEEILDQRKKDAALFPDSFAVGRDHSQNGRWYLYPSEIIREGDQLYFHLGIRDAAFERTLETKNREIAELKENLRMILFRLEKNHNLTSKDVEEIFR